MKNNGKIKFSHRPKIKKNEKKKKVTLDKENPTKMIIKPKKLVI